MVVFPAAAISTTPHALPLKLVLSRPLSVFRRAAHPALEGDSHFDRSRRSAQPRPSQIASHLSLYPPALAPSFMRSRRASERARPSCIGGARSPSRHPLSPARAAALADDPRARVDASARLAPIIDEPAPGPQAVRAERAMARSEIARRSGRHCLDLLARMNASQSRPRSDGNGSPSFIRPARGSNAPTASSHRPSPTDSFAQNTLIGHPPRGNQAPPILQPSQAEQVRTRSRRCVLCKSSWNVPRSCEKLARYSFSDF